MMRCSCAGEKGFEAEAGLVGLAAQVLLVLLEREHVADVFAGDDLEDLQFVQLGGDEGASAVHQSLVHPARLQVEDGDLDPGIARRGQGAGISGLALVQCQAGNGRRAGSRSRSARPPKQFAAANPAR